MGSFLSPREDRQGAGGAKPTREERSKSWDRKEKKEHKTEINQSNNKALKQEEQGKE